MQFTAKKEQKILEILSQMSPDSSKNTLRSWLKLERVCVNGSIIKGTNNLVNSGDVITVGKKQEIPDKGIKIIFNDHEVIVVDKPVGILSVSTDHGNEKNLHSYLKEKYHPKRVHVIHRLDRETSGLILYAHTDQATSKLKDMLEKRLIKREYRAIIEGTLEKKTGTWESYLYEDQNFKVHSSGDASKGKRAVTHYEVLASTKGYSYLRLNLESGRKNQIRVHCYDAGHPIIGDVKYGAVADPLKRLCLHAHKLTFQHPLNGKAMAFESPVPIEYSKLFKELR
ncbi:MAG: 23S rRNA pseudouridine1911/1915/1917 synthase [Chlamydiales bacterium]|jgi:23S rRNA pseudouridine1911/1915/1917 synthase